METEDDDTIVARNTGKPLPHSDMSECRLDLYGTLDDKSRIAVCDFFAKRYGHYGCRGNDACRPVLQHRSMIFSVQEVFKHVRRSSLSIIRGTAKYAQ